MVQYIITPWRHRKELLSVRRAFYPPSETTKATADKERHEAVELVSVWVQRGNCPHSVESTALLVSAILNEAAGNSAYAMRATYSAAFSRFVTGLLDGYQDKKHKLSMYSIAKNIGLPATFVELRHQCTHEELPSLSKLRAATERSLLWIWDHYWKHLQESGASVGINERRGVLREYLQWLADSKSQEQDQEQKQFHGQLRKWSKGHLLEGLTEIINTNTTQPSILREALRISRAILSGEEVFTTIAPPKHTTSTPEKNAASLEDIRADIARAEAILQEQEAEGEEFPNATRNELADAMEEDDDDEGTGWAMWKGPWIPKPIGVL